MNVLKMLFLFSKSAPMCKSLWACAGENRISERIKALECAALVCIWSGRSLVPFSRKLGTHKAWKDMYFYVNLKPVSVDTGLWEPMVSFGQVERGLSFERNISWLSIRKNLGPFVWFRSVPSIKKKKKNRVKSEKRFGQSKKVSSKLLHIQLISFLSILFPLCFLASSVSFISSLTLPMKVMVSSFFFFFS